MNTLYIVLTIILTIWIFFDAKKRKNKYVLWGLASLIIWPILIPFYIANRNLLPNETIEGGKVWIVCKFFILIWTIFIGTLFTIGIFNASASVDTTNEAEVIGSSIGIFLGGGIYFIVWIGPVFITLLLGLILRKNITEKYQESTKG